MAIKNKEWLNRADIKEATGLSTGPNTLVVISGPDFNIEVPKSIPVVIPLVDSIELCIDREGKIEVTGMGDEKPVYMDDLVVYIEDLISKNMSTIEISPEPLLTDSEQTGIEITVIEPTAANKIKPYYMNTLIENFNKLPQPLKGVHLVTKKPTADQVVTIIEEVIKLIESDEHHEHSDIIRVGISILAQASAVESEELGTANDIWHKDIVGVEDTYKACLDVLKSYKAIIEKDPADVNDAKYVKAVLYCEVLLYGYSCNGIS